MLKNILKKVGNTPLVALEDHSFPNLNIFAKLEFYNPMGSVKDRAASYLLEKLLTAGLINRDSMIIESSSGNMGIALAAYCKMYGLKFCCVIDPNISPSNEQLINKLSYRTVKVSEPDQFGGYLLTRIKTVKELLNEYPQSYWVNQYGNRLIAEAYENSLGNELCRDLKRIDYLFVSVSSGGTITGISRRVKKSYPEAKVIAVDMEGSVVFGEKPQKRAIPGIGSSMVPDILSEALIDEVVIVDESSTIEMCNLLLEEHTLFVGGSSGSVFAAVDKYFSARELKQPANAVLLFPDRGDRYLNTVYNDDWCNQNIKVKVKG